jgi:hypothetical protein
MATTTAAAAAKATVAVVAAAMATRLRLVVVVVVLVRDRFVMIGYSIVEGYERLARTERLLLLLRCGGRGNGHGWVGLDGVSMNVRESAPFHLKSEWSFCVSRNCMQNSLTVT